MSTANTTCFRCPTFCDLYLVTCCLLALGAVQCSLFLLLVHQQSCVQQYPNDTIHPQFPFSEFSLFGQVATTADRKAKNTAGAVATAVLPSTPPLTPATPCLVSSARTTASGASDIKEFFGKRYEQDIYDDNDHDNDGSKDGDDDGDDPGRDYVLGDPPLPDGDDNGSVVNTTIEVG